MPEPALTKVHESDKANIAVFLTCFVTILIALWMADYWFGGDDLATARTEASALRASKPLSD